MLFPVTEKSKENDNKKKKALLHPPKVVNPVNALPTSHLAPLRQLIFDTP
jgi:hypothetical protein